MLFSGGALRAQALAILAVAEIGLAASMGSPHHGPRASTETLTVAFADRPLADALLGGYVPFAPAPAPAKPVVVPHPAKAAPAPKPLAHHGRYVPTGTGMWTYLWNETEGGNAKRIVARAQRIGLTHLYVRTGTRAGGFDGGPVLKKILPATKGTDLKVIAWDFPTLANPVADAKRLAAAANFKVKGAPRVAAVAPDIETGSEGTVLSAARVDQYLTTLRRLIPDDMAIIGVTPWPSEHRLGKYPYAHVAKYSDALAPMAYWINRDPATVTHQSMHRLARFRKPILPIGQAYDPRIDVPSLHIGPPTRAQVDAFFHMASRLGAPAASLWVWQFASTGQWQSISTARGMYRG
jgi:hypothetical protein